ncbi:MAG: hypothetical protein ACRC8S_00435 [Fimbriiglobus sp.]
MKITFEVTPKTTKDGYLLTHKIINVTSPRKTRSLATFKKMLNSKLNLYLDKKNRFQKIEGMDEVIDQVLGDQKENVPAKSLKFMQETFQTLYESVFMEAFFPLPKKDEETVVKCKVNIPGLLKYNLDKKYTGPKLDSSSDLHRYNLEAKAKFTNPKKSDLLPASVQSIKENKPTEYTGIILFDAKTGLPKSVTVKTKIDLQTKIGVEDNVVKMQLLEERTIKIEYFKELPE